MGEDKRETLRGGWQYCRLHLSIKSHSGPSGDGAKHQQHFKHFNRRRLKLMMIMMLPLVTCDVSVLDAEMYTAYIACSNSRYDTVWTSIGVFSLLRRLFYSCTFACRPTIYITCKCVFIQGLQNRVIKYRTIIFMGYLRTVYWWTICNNAACIIDWRLHMCIHIMIKLIHVDYTY